MSGFQSACRRQGDGKILHLQLLSRRPPWSGNLYSGFPVEPCPAYADAWAVTRSFTDTAGGLRNKAQEGGIP